jgi:urease accessory protein
MAFGGALGVLGVPLPVVETAIALSGVMLGIMVALVVHPPLWVAALMVGFFAIFHGHAHGTELPHAANAVTYAVGLVLATGLLHLCGIAVGLLICINVRVARTTTARAAPVTPSRAEPPRSDTSA